MEEQVLSMEEVKQKLARLEEFIPNAANNLVYDFGRFLATYLNPELVPSGFTLGCILALHDLQSGVNGFTGQRIRNNLVGYPPIIYTLLRMEIPHIADAVLPADFSASVKTLLKEAVDAVSKKQ